MLEKALELLKIFNDNGYGAYLVGGFVRDYILKKESIDIDICTNATPKQIKDIFNNVTLPYEKYGSVNLKYKNVVFEITTYRMDLEYNNFRSPSKILYTNSLIIDLKRRDFTMNTICMDQKGNIIDLLDGIKDVKQGIIKTVGNADLKLKEDSLRILRAIRFATELSFKIDENLRLSILKNASLLEKLSFYRKKQELNRILSSNNYEYGLTLIKNFKLENYLGIKIPNRIVKTNDVIGMWAQLNPCNDYQFTKNEKNYLDKINKLILKNKISDMDIYKLENYVCSIAAQILKIDEASIHERYDNLPIKKQQDIDLKVNDMISFLNLKDKSIIKTIISDLEYKIINRQLENSYDKIKNYLITNYSMI